MGLTKAASLAKNMSNKYNYIIGLTGNIACGKSTVVAELERLGAHVIDADHVTRLLQQPGQPVFDSIVTTFGADILQPDGQINRRALGEIVFTDVLQLRALEALIHPGVHHHIKQWLAELPIGSADSPVVAVIDAIKLIESGWPAICNAVWVVTAPRELQIERLCRTRNMSLSAAITRIDVQSPQAEKTAVADVVIDNHGDFADTFLQVQHQWQKLFPLLDNTHERQS